MCEFVNNNICTLTNNVCPYMSFCNRLHCWKPSPYMPKNCKIKKNAEIPKGYYKVCYVKRNKLYVSIDGYVEIFDNPFNEAPAYVKVIKKKNGEKVIKK